MDGVSDVAGLSEFVGIHYVVLDRLRIPLGDRGTCLVGCVAAFALALPVASLGTAVACHRTS